MGAEYCNSLNAPLRISMVHPAQTSAVYAGKAKGYSGSVFPLPEFYAAVVEITWVNPVVLAAAKQCDYYSNDVAGMEEGGHTFGEQYAHLTRGAHIWSVGGLVLAGALP